LDKAEFESVIHVSLSNTLKSVGEDCLASVQSLLGGERAPVESLVEHMGDVDAVLDELFGKFSQLKLDPPSLGSSLFWMVEELRSALWKGQG